MIRRLFGVPILCLGLALGGWMLYNLFIERMVEAEGRPTFVGAMLSIGLLYVGTQWIRGKAAGR